MKPLRRLAAVGPYSLGGAVLQRRLRGCFSPSDLLLRQIQIDSYTLLWQGELLIYTCTPRHRESVKRSSAQPQGRKQSELLSAQRWKQDGWAFCSKGLKQAAPGASVRYAAL